MKEMPSMNRNENEPDMSLPEAEGEMDLELTPLPDKEMPSRPSTEVSQVIKLKNEIKGLEKMEVEKLNKMHATMSREEGVALKEEIEKIKEQIDRLRKEKDQLESFPDLTSDLTPEAIKEVENAPVDLTEESIEPLEDEKAA